VLFHISLSPINPPFQRLHLKVALILNSAVKKSLKSRYPRPGAGHYARLMASLLRFLINYKLTHSFPSTGRGILRKFDKFPLSQLEPLKDNKSSLIAW